MATALIFLELMAESGPVLAADRAGNANYPGVPQSNLYQVTITDAGASRRLTVFQNTCPKYQPGEMNMLPVDQYPLKLFHGDSISWTAFSLSHPVTVEIHASDASNGPVIVRPAKYGITPVVDGNPIRFTLTQPGQYAVEAGPDGRKHALLLFADPPETDRPNPADGYCILTNATPSAVAVVPAEYSGLYFKNGVHDIGVYHVPAHIKNIYFESGAWVYGALIMDGHPKVKIFGRGVLSEARLNYRESHAIEAAHQSDQIDLEGFVVADTKYFAVRLLGRNNTVKWVKVTGGWTYNTDGIAAFGGSTVAHCFIRANDDSLKPYADNLSISDCVVWQMNNGAVIQLSWGNAKAANVTISNVDILHAEWNNNAVNRGIVSCVGDKFAKGGMSGRQQSFVIENLTTETPVPFVFNVRPNPASPDEIHGFVMKDWDIKTDPAQNYPNYIQCNDPSNRFDGFVFDHFKWNGVTLNPSNWIATGRFVITNLAPPVFNNDLP